MDEIKNFNEIMNEYSSFLDKEDNKLPLDQKMLILELLYLYLQNMK